VVFEAGRVPDEAPDRWLPGGSGLPVRLPKRERAPRRGNYPAGAWPGGGLPPGRSEGRTA
jgi:hypothetical protein